MDKMRRVFDGKIAAKRKKAWLENEASLNLKDLKPRKYLPSDLKKGKEKHFKIDPRPNMLDGCQRAILKYFGMTIEEAYFCRKRGRPEDLDTCGWVRGLPAHKPFNLKTFFGQFIFCRICNKQIGILHAPYTPEIKSKIKGGGK